MSKISLKNILKKTFKKKTKPKTKIIKSISASKVKKVKKTKTKSKQKKIIKIAKVKKITKINTKKKNEKPEIKSEALRIPKSNELKPEIKKVKKQETAKKEYKIKDYVVYPKHGVGQISEFKKINIGGIDVETYVIKFEKDKANGCLLYTSPSPRDVSSSRMPSSA